MWLCPKGLNATPTVDISKNTIYAVSTDGRLYALDLATGEEKYRSQQWVPAFAKAWSLNRIGGRALHDLVANTAAIRSRACRRSTFPIRKTS